MIDETAPSSSLLSSALDLLLWGLLAALLAFLPAAYGTTEPWSQEIAVKLASALAIGLALKFIGQCAHDPRTRFSWSPAALAVMVFFGLAIVQLLPMPPEIVGFLSPRTLSLKQELLSDVPGGLDSLRRVTLSFYPWATRIDLRVIGIDITVFTAVMMLCRKSWQITSALFIMAFVGGALGLIAIAQDVTHATSVYWHRPGTVHLVSGPFANHSHYAQFMSLAIGAMLALLLTRIGKLRAPTVSRGSRVLQFAWIVILIGLAILCAASIFLSLSRGGVVAVAVAALFTLAMLAWRGSARGAIVVAGILGLGVFIVLLCFGFDAVWTRLNLLHDSNGYNVRTVVVHDLIPCFKMFPLAGTGLGTHEFIYPMFDRSLLGGVSTHAENEMAQVMEEMGLVGVICLAVFVLAVWRAYFRSLRNPNTPMYIAALGLGFGLMAVMIHSLSDFGQHYPGVGGFSAATCGLLLAMGQLAPGARGPSEPGPMRRIGPVAMSGIILLAVAAASAWAIQSARITRVGDDEATRAEELASPLAQNKWQGSNEAFANLLIQSERAVAADPEQVYYRYDLNDWRWRSISRVHWPNGDVMVTPDTLAFTRQIVDDLHAQRILCPTFGRPLAMAGQLEYLILHEPAGEEHLALAYRLGDGDARTCMYSAWVDGAAGHWDDVMPKMKRAVALDATFMSQAQDILLNKLHRPEMLIDLADGKPQGLLIAVDKLGASSEGRPFVREALDRANDSVQTDPQATAYVCGLVADEQMKIGDFQGAADNYGRATQREYGSPYYHVRRADALIKLRDLDGAMREVQSALHLDPSYQPARQLVEEISRAQFPLR